MAKISVSLQDDLKARLDAYAQAHGQSVSEVIQDSLKAFLDGTTPEPGHPPTPPPTPTDPSPTDRQLAKQIQLTQNHFLHFLAHYEQLRNSVDALCQFAQMTHGVVILRPQQPYPTPNFSSLE